MMAKSFSGAKYNINTEYEQKKFFFSFLTVSNAKTCWDLGIGSENLGKKYFFRIANLPRFEFG